MKHRSSITLPMALTLAVIGLTPAALASEHSPGSSSSTQDKVQTGEVKSVTAHYSKPMQRLLEAAQRLRDATHTMAANDDRAGAIRQTNDALIATQQAMIEVPFDLRQAPKSAMFDQKAMHRLQEAAQRLRDSAQALADKPGTKDRNASIRQINKALWETQEAMIALLPETDSTANTADSDKASTTGGQPSR